MLERLEGGRGWSPSGRPCTDIFRLGAVPFQLWYLCTIEFHYIYDPKLAKPIAGTLLRSRWDDTIARLG